MMAGVQLPPRVIAIAGPSCSGKSGLARELARALAHHDPVIFPMDAYYRDLSHLPAAEADLRNFDHPDALEWPLLKADFEALLRGEVVEHPVYDFATHVRQPEGVRIGPAGLVIVEGLFALQRETIRRKADLSVYLQIDEDVSSARRLERDVSERGIEPGLVQRQFIETVAPMAREYVWPSRGSADLLLDGEMPLSRSVALVVRFFGA
jgi:uridine kinase